MPTVIKEEASPASQLQSGGAMHVFANPQSDIPTPPDDGVSPDGFNGYPNTVLEGSTAHFHVYFDTTTLGAGAGKVAADAVLARCENDYNTLSGWFGGLTPASFNVIIAGNIGGAYHYGCAAADLYCDGTNPADPNLTNMLVIAEEVEVFEAQQNRGWNCGASNGEGLSRVLATALYPSALDGFTSAASWLDTPNRPNFVDVTDPTDRNYVSIGCSVLFLNWLRYQLDFTWQEICAAGAPTLGQTYTNLTKQNDGWQQFSALMQAYFPLGKPSGLTNDNPFPLTGLHTFPICGVQWQGTVPAKSSRTWFTFGWPEIWEMIWTVVPLTVTPGSPSISYSLQVERGGASLTYWITVTNLSAQSVDIEGRYSILGVV